MGKSKLKWTTFHQKWPNSKYIQSISCMLKNKHFESCTMKKYRVLQLGLQLGFLVVIDTCNSWYLYNLECYRTSCSSCNGHLMSYIVSYIWCNSHAIICNFFATNFHIIFPHTLQRGEKNANVAFHPFVDEWCTLIPFATYLQLFYN